MKKIFYTFLVLAGITLQSCSETKKKTIVETPKKTIIDNLKVEQSKATKIIDELIATHGGKLYSNSEISFDFRKVHYNVKRNNDLFAYSRSFKNKEEKSVFDKLDNNGFERTINNKIVALDDKWKTKYGNSVNSVAYFISLPFGLNDKAVIKDYLGEVNIKEESYHKIKVRFSEDGGGEDFQDVFIYWIHKQQKTLDYLAYSYQTSGGGKRFRAAYNRKKIGGIIFQDYINYKEIDGKTALATYDKLYEEGKLKELSKIENINIEVKQNP